MPTRRTVLWAAAALAGGLAVGVGWPVGRRLAQRHAPAATLGAPGGAPCQIEVHADGSVVVYTTLTELGQGVLTAVAQIAGEELDAAWEHLSVQTAPGWRAWEAPVGFYTGGSLSVRRLYGEFRRVAAAARALLVAEAAARWGVAVDECRTADSAVHHDASGQRLAYGALAAAAARRSPPQDPPLKPRSAWRLIGRSLVLPRAAALVTGAARYGIDVTLPGLRVAAVAQAPFAGATLRALDREALLAQPGVRQVIELDGRSEIDVATVAVLADDSWRAQQALSAVPPQWQHGAEDTAELRERLLAAAAPGGTTTTAGEVAAVYEVPFVTHAQMEPLCTTARVGRFDAEVWAPTQVQEATRTQVAKALGLWEHAVTVHTPQVGGGFGRRLRVDFCVTAARIAQAAGAPVKTVWSRAEDTAQGRFRPMAAARLALRLDAQGRPERFEARVAGIGDSPRLAGLEPQPYRLGATEVRYVPVTSAIRTGPWRSVDESQNVFFRESFLDECALAAGADPLDWRMALLAGQPRAQRLLARLGELTGWAAARRAGRALGMAFGDGLGSLCALAAEVVADAGGAWRVAQIQVVVDCGTVVNPAGVRAQLEGGVLFGLSAALHEEIRYRAGRLEPANFDGYRVLRLADAPPITVDILESPEADIGGIGEVGVPPVAPAVANAVHAATGVRLRWLPLQPRSTGAAV